MSINDRPEPYETRRLRTQEKDFRRGIGGLIVLSIIIGVLAGYLLALLLTVGACS